MKFTRAISAAILIHKISKQSMTDRVLPSISQSCCNRRALLCLNMQGSCQHQRDNDIVDRVVLELLSENSISKLLRLPPRSTETNLHIKTV